MGTVSAVWVQLYLIPELFIGEFADGDNLPGDMDFAERATGNFHGHLDSDGQANSGIESE